MRRGTWGNIIFELVWLVILGLMTLVQLGYHLRWNRYPEYHGLVESPGYFFLVFGFAFAYLMATAVLIVSVINDLWVKIDIPRSDGWKRLMKVFGAFFILLIGIAAWSVPIIA